MADPIGSAPGNGSSDVPDQGPGGASDRLGGLVDTPPQGRPTPSGIDPSNDRIECGFCTQGSYLKSDEQVFVKCPYCNGRGYVDEEHHGY